MATRCRQCLLWIAVLALPPGWVETAVAAPSRKRGSDEVEAVSGCTRISEDAGHGTKRSRAEDDEHEDVQRDGARPSPKVLQCNDMTLSCGCESEDLVVTCDLDGSVDRLDACERSATRPGDGVPEPNPPSMPEPTEGYAGRLHFVDVGVGSCQIIEPYDVECPVMIVDCGQRGNAYALSPMDVKAYVERIVVGRDLVVVASHPDLDHYSYLGEIVDQASQEPGRAEPIEIYFGGKREKYGSRFGQQIKRNSSQDGMDANLRIKGRPDPRHSLMECPTDDASPLRVRALAAADPDAKEPGSKNAQSVVVGLRHGSFGAVLPGDAEGTTERAAMDRGRAGALFDGRGHYVVLAASHHGAATKGSNGNAWSKYWKERTRDGDLTVVFSAGYTSQGGAGAERLRTRYGHPRSEAYGRYFGGTPPASDRTVVVCSNASTCVERTAHANAYTTPTCGTLVVEWSADPDEAPKMTCSRPRQGPEPSRDKGEGQRPHEQKSVSQVVR